MIEFFQKADTDGNQLVTRDELRGAIAVYDTSGTIGFNPQMPEFGDGFLGQRELASFHDGAIGAYSDPVEQLDERGVAQIITVDGTRTNNEGFFRELPEFRGYS
jgi:hypothetical protein